ncbi:hypothetical protein ACMFMF_010232 [Clarireedia jacksonii]
MASQSQRNESAGRVSEGAGRQSVDPIPTRITRQTARRMSSIAASRAAPPQRLRRIEPPLANAPRPPALQNTDENPLLAEEIEPLDAEMANHSQPSPSGSVDASVDIERPASIPNTAHQNLEPLLPRGRSERTPLPNGLGTQGRRRPIAEVPGNGYMTRHQPRGNLIRLAGPPAIPSFHSRQAVLQNGTLGPAQLHEFRPSSKLYIALTRAYYLNGNRTELIFQYQIVQVEQLRPDEIIQRRWGTGRREDRPNGFCLWPVRLLAIDVAPDSLVTRNGNWQTILIGNVLSNQRLGRILSCWSVRFPAELRNIRIEELTYCFVRNALAHLRQYNVAEPVTDGQGTVVDALPAEQMLDRIMGDDIFDFPENAFVRFMRISSAEIPITRSQE